MSKHYKAHIIATTERWTWDGDTPPDANRKPGPGPWPGLKQQPILQRGDTIVLRLEQNKGPHIITLINQSNPAKLPFAYPFDLHTFEYNPDTDVLVCVGLEGKTDTAVWKFFIESKSGGPRIDPEFQVGPGGITGDNQA